MEGAQVVRATLDGRWVENPMAVGTKVDESVIGLHSQAEKPHVTRRLSVMWRFGCDKIFPQRNVAALILSISETLPTRSAYVGCPY